MKKILAIVFALVLVLAMAVPAMASISTSVNVTANGTAPVVLCKWETPDDDAATDGTQVSVPAGTVVAGNAVPGTKQLWYWAVVTHPLGISNVTGVYADVFHPNVKQLVNIVGTQVDAQWCKSLKYQVVLSLWNRDSNETQVAALHSAVVAKLVTFKDTATTEATVTEMLNQGEAELYQGTEYVNTCQPSGIYTVNVTAASGSTYSNIVTNTFTVLKTQAFVVDFTAINYGDVAVGNKKQIGGDTNLGTADKATIWNNGNVYLNIKVTQNDAGFGSRSVGGTPVWNVHWDARLGPERQGEANNGSVLYDPNAAPVIIPGVLVMCTPTKLDFSILVDKAPAGAGSYTGTMTLSAVEVPFIPCGP